MKYQSKKESQLDHIKNYRSDGVAKQKGTKYSPDFLRVKFLLDNTQKSAYVLDVGCNGGTVAIPLMAMGCYVKGIDIVPELVEAAKARGVFAEVGEAENLRRYKATTFDCVICSEVLEHLYDPLSAIKEAKRVLKKGGKYLVTVPHPNSEMCKGLGDYHHQNFSMETLDTLFHLVFKRGNVELVEIPYTQEYCLANKDNLELMGKPQWLGIIATK